MIAEWCRRLLGAGVDRILFSTGHLSQVVGVHLDDGRDVVVKVRPAADRLAGCAGVQKALWSKGFPCPEPLAGPIVQDGMAVSAETLVSGGEMLGPAGDAVTAYAELLARLIRSAPKPSEVGSVLPNPPWTDWRHDRDGVWPLPDDRDVDLNTIAGPAWLDDAAGQARARLFQADDWPAVIGHGDWEAQNLRWHGGKPLVVRDWDSVVCGPEAVIVGLAAAVWPCGAEPRPATIDESKAFLDGYQEASERIWSADEIEVSWAAGLWVDAFNTKKASLDGHGWLDPAQASERLRRAGA